MGHWKSHTKSELALANGVPVMGADAQRPKRIGRCYWRKPKGSISPDVIIVKSRNQPPTPQNTTHCVDMKFGKDDFDEEQARRYLQRYPDKLVVLYFPTDCTIPEPEESEKENVELWTKILALLLVILSRGRGGIKLPSPRFPVPLPY